MQSYISRNSKRIFYGIAFILFVLSFYLNLFKIAPDLKYTEYETFEEALVLGRMAKAEKDGFFAASGFTGVNHSRPDSIISEEQVNDLTLRDYVISETQFDQKKYYIGEEKTPNGYCVYVSHSGGQASLYYLIQKILPFSKETCYQILRLLNAVLMAISFLVFIGWILRNVGFIAAVISFVLIFLSPWIVLFGGNGLWWSLWNFYVPFLTMLLLLEEKYSLHKDVSDRKIYAMLFLALTIKFFFSGLEFISTVILSIFIPIIYYAYLERWQFLKFMKHSLKATMVALGALVLQFIVLALQLWNLLRNPTAAIRYIESAFTRRSSFGEFASASGATEDTDSFLFTWNNVIKFYLRENSTDWGFSPIFIRIRFIYLFLIIIACAAIIYLLTKQLQDRKYKALILSVFISVICPLSWYIIFKEHAFWHVQLDVIVWYMPFLLLGFTLIATTLSLLITKVLKSK
ncbi:hypothetical protein [Prevotella sp. 10(H)]|uniref:hypothetical protein n=1 Tax=Prevotella sp. 10(H) TaxID=1158294 RepID=UPI0004A73A65|nr:hypothetical protein [Prevotella sp. 10(H)]